MPMAPRPMAETRRPWPRSRVCIDAPVLYLEGGIRGVAGFAAVGRVEAGVDRLVVDMGERDVPVDAAGAGPAPPRRVRVRVHAIHKTTWSGVRPVGGPAGGDPWYERTEALPRIGQHPDRQTG